MTLRFPDDLCVCGLRADDAEHIAVLGGTHAFTGKSNMSCIGLSKSWGPDQRPGQDTALCGRRPALQTEKLGWAVREFVTCETCRLLVALAEANGLHPIDPEFKTKLDALLEDSK